MTDLEICEQLAERVHGWKIAPDNSCEKYYERQKFFGDDANYPSYDPAYKMLWRDRSCAGVKRDPFESWDDAMALVRSDGVGAEILLREVRIMALKAYFPPGDEAAWLLERATPRDLVLCVARATGIEVEG